MSLNLDSYQYSGEELLDRLDELNSSLERARYALTLEEEINHLLGIRIPENHALENRQTEYWLDQVREAEAELDTFFEEETTKFPIETVNENERGNTSYTVTIMNTGANSYTEIVNSFQEINGNLSEGEPTTKHSEVPSMITAVDHSDLLIETWEKLQNTYKFSEN
ncbi:hypothetical protein [Candidatus Nanohalobium constans]|uniref:Uncharacterized protein n=1 Tax=Candidatus Nanohalobium constans TaxID=2565781 RepID=A0A5Q0UFK2_9ARCH|nr:hypothetical protein [Candidatus Nanohalobium constans]QGA80392.1 hypothetical protein LC1Nh_0492 [Candidatus Nanohalobium constans]